MFKFKRHGAHGTWVSELLPNIAGIVDDVTLIKSMHTEAINHDPAITYILTGTQQLGKPSFGSWISYGLGSENKDLPAYLVMISKGRGQSQALYSRLWNSGFLPSKHQGVNLRSGREPVLFLKDPEGIDRPLRRRMLDGIAKINQEQFSEFGDPETQTRISAYEMAFRMQASVPDLMDVSKEPKAIKEMYGKDTAKPGTFASNCILARRMAERGVPFIHLFHRGWDQHGALPVKLRQQCEDVDQPVAALIKDLKQRGLLDTTLVHWGGEMGRLPVIQKKTGYAIETIKDALLEIQKFDPFPGREFEVQQVQKVTPDLSVERDNKSGKYVIKLEDEYTPTLRISKHYREMLRNGADKQTKEYIKKKIDSAKWLIESIEQRYSTLKRVAQAIVDFQQDFLENGPESIVPLKMQQVADVVGVHVTTVSRAVDDKWIQTPRGIFSLRRFFGGGTKTDSGEDVAWDIIRMKLQEIIDAEDKDNPYSDDALVEQMKKLGYTLARRTVTKYRKKMNIPSSRQRRHY